MPSRYTNRFSLKNNRETSYYLCVSVRQRTVVSQANMAELEWTKYCIVMYHLRRRCRHFIRTENNNMRDTKVIFKTTLTSALRSRN